MFFFFSSRRRHTRYWRDWSSDVCSSDLFADFLRGRLELERPGLAGELHLRASGWYEQNGHLDEAIGHALSAPDHGLAARLRSEERRVGKECRSRWSPYH